VNSRSESPNLDFLRSFAVAAVLFDHVNRQAGHPYYGAIGRAGVLLFFIHTALVLMFSLERLDSRGGRLVAPFYIQRVFRIYPLCWFFIAVMVSFRIPGAHLIGLGYHWGGWLWLAKNLLLIQNFTFTSFVLGVLWSLPYEVQMYIALPFIYRTACRSSPLVRISVLWLASAIITLAMNRYYVAARGPNYDDSLHSPLTYFVPCFLGGVFAFILTKRKRLYLHFWLLPPVILSFAMLIYYYPFTHADWVGCTVVGVLLPQFSELRWIPAARVFHNVAKYSYGVYLSHSPLLWIVFAHFPGLPLFSRWIIFTGLLAMVSVACYWWIERPMIDLGHRYARRLASVPRGDSATVDPAESKATSGA
jgi:peptidoglycan/LPS O-acetylase OafA/YrhL